MTFFRVLDSKNPERRTELLSKEDFPMLGKSDLLKVSTLSAKLAHQIQIVIHGNELAKSIYTAIAIGRSFPVGWISHSTLIKGGFSNCLWLVKYGNQWYFIEVPPESDTDVWAGFAKGQLTKVLNNLEQIFMS